MASSSPGGEEAAGAVGMPQLNFDTWPSQIFWTAVALFALYWLVTNKVLPRLSGALEGRHHAIADDLDRAAEFKRQAEEAEAAYDKALADARAKAQEIADETRAEISTELETAVAHADAEIEARTAESEVKIAEVRAAAAVEAKAAAADVARAIVASIAPSAVDDSALEDAVERALKAQGGA